MVKIKKYFKFTKEEEQIKVNTFNLLKLKQVLQCFIKGGNKATVEIMLKKMLFYMAQNKKIYKKQSWFVIMVSIHKMNPFLNLKVIKVKRRVFYKIKFMALNNQNYLLYSWLIKSVQKNHHNFYKNLAQEFKNSYYQKGGAFTKSQDFLKSIEENIRFYKGGKKKYRSKNFNSYKQKNYRTKKIRKI